jgi:hypothetical protein
MKIASARKLQYPLDNLIKVLKFVWRHVFTLSAVGMIIYGIYQGKTPIISGTFIVLGAATLIDWFKMKLKFSSRNNNSRGQMFESARRNMDSSRFGSSAWATNPAMAGSPANHLYNLGYTTTNQR